MSALVADGSGLALTSPGGQHRLTLAGDCLVSGDGVTYERSAGVWQILDPSRLDEVAQFTTAYARVRAAEGRGSNSAEYYSALPYQDLTGKLQSQWTQRAASFDQFGMALARIRQSGVLVDVGAGNCWLAARMAAAGWTALAIDINADLHDGLGAAHHHGQDLCVVQATMDAQPLADHSADIVVFNASIHYSRSVLESLEESLRVLRLDGTLVVMDSPVYQDPDAGRRMVAEASRHIEAELGVPAAPLAGQGFVTDTELAEASRAFGVAWRDVGAEIRGGLRAVKRRVAAVRARRELARRPVLFGTRQEAISP
jgi:SAM-dependent methyltransferase